jgi:hypothetical protein
MIEAIGYMFIGVFFASLFPALKAWSESKSTWVDLTEEEKRELKNANMPTAALIETVCALLKAQNK